MRAATLAAAVVLDRAMTHLPTPLHPVGWIGHAISAAAGQPTGKARSDLWRGTVTVVVITVGAVAVGSAVEAFGRRFPLARLAEVGLLASSFSLHGLLSAAERPAAALDDDDLDGARDALSWLVSRPRAELDEAHVASAAIESLSENLADSVTGPLLAYAIGGLPAALAYRVVNTADAMLGYRDEREWLGRSAARADDVLNLVPARLTAVALAITAPAVGARPGYVLERARAEAARTASPNSGWPMAAAAAGLDIWLAKPGSYRLGAGQAPGPTSLRRAIRWTGLSGYLVAGTAIAVSTLRGSRR